MLFGNTYFVLCSRYQNVCSALISSLSYEYILSYKARSQEAVHYILTGLKIHVVYYAIVIYGYFRVSTKTILLRI